MSEKTNTVIEIERLFITFRGDVQLEGVYIEDEKQDTLLHIGALQAGVAFLPLIDGSIAISRIRWDGLVANVKRSRDSTFNFDFLIDAFAGNTDSNTTEEANKQLPKIGLGPVHFANFKLRYRDDVVGLNAKLNLGALNLSTDEIDLNTLTFKVNELALTDATLDASQWLAATSSADTTSHVGLPFIGCNNLHLQNVKVSYRSTASKLIAATDVGELQLTNAVVDLDKNDISANQLQLKNTLVYTQLPAAEPSEPKTTPTQFEWPVWQIRLQQLALENNALEMSRVGTKETPEAFNANDLRVTNLQLLMEDISLTESKAALFLKNAAFKEKSGFELRQLTFKTELTNQALIVWNLDLKTPNNLLKTNVSVTYPSIQHIVNNPLDAGFNLDLAEANLSITDAYFFAPELKTDTLFQTLGAYPTQLQGNITGSVSDFMMNDLKMSALHELELHANGRIGGLPNMRSLRVDVPSLDVSWSRKDVAIFLKDEAQMSSIPEEMQLRATLKGNSDSLQSEVDVKTDKGTVNLTAHTQNLFDVPSATGQLILKNVAVAELASVPEMEPVSATLDFDARGNNLENITANIGFNFQQLVFRQYDYSDLKLHVTAADKNAKVSAGFQDQNLDFDLVLNAMLDTVKPAAKAQLNLTGINLLALGLSTENVKLGANLNAAFNGLPSKFESHVQLTEVVLVKEREVFRLQPLQATLSNAATNTALRLSSEIVNGSLHANTSIDSIVGSLKRYVKTLTNTDSLRGGIMNDSLDVKAHFTVNNSRLLTDALLPQLTQLDSIQLDLEFHPSKNKLHFNFLAPRTVYAGFELDSLGVFANANDQNLTAQLAFKSLQGGLVDIHRTLLIVGFKDKIANLKLTMADSVGGKLAAIGTTVDLTTTNTKVSLDANDLVLNRQEWSVPVNNSALFSEKGITFQAMNLTSNLQQVHLENLKSGNGQGMKVRFDGFRLASLATLLNAEDSLLNGALNGTVRLINLNKTPGIDADVKVNELAVLGLDMGQLSLLANTKNTDGYNLDLKVKGKSIDLATSGTLNTKNELEIAMQTDVNRLDVRLLEKMFAPHIKSASGAIEAHSSISGSVSDLQYKGSLIFNGASVTPRQLNTQFRLPNDRVEIDNSGLVFKAFKIVDENDNEIQVNGEIGTRNMLDPTFDLKITASNFQPLNSTRDDNDLFYGKAFLDADITVDGKLSLPKINAKAKLLKGTNITFIVPETQAAIEERKGLVRFANMKDTLNSILIPEKQIEEVRGITGVDLIGYIEVDKKTKFEIVIDERSGDKLEIEGEAKLNAEVTPNGVVSLSGDYEVESGFYKLNFYGLAKRQFNLVSGSRIAWSGDPLAADLNLTAKYSLKTSATDLMADQLVQSDATTLTKYKQALPFEVMLHVDGELLKPTISFGIDMPASARQALDGNVYKRVRQLNSTTSELDKQVFSLIVLNRFLPRGFNQTDGNGGERLARSSASKLLSGQLNALSAKYLKGVELNFDLNSYTDYQSGVADDKTKLDVNIRKALFNDRVVVQVGGQVDIEGRNKSYGVDDILGDISLEYLLTKEGDYRLKAFRKNEFQDLVQGQVVVMGLSVLFNKSFNDWNELLRGKPRPENEAKPEDDSEQNSESPNQE